MRFRAWMKLLILGLHLCVVALSFTHCDARRTLQPLRRYKDLKSSIISIKSSKRLQVSKHFNVDTQSDTSNSGPYGVSSPFSMPPYDSLAPIPLPENAPPYCLYPPFTPQPPSTTIPFPPPSGSGGGGGGGTPIPSNPPPPSSSSPILPGVNPPPSPTGANPSPPESYPFPNPPEIIPSPPEGSILSPPMPNPPEIVPSPPEGSVLSPPIFGPSPTGPTLSPPPSFEPSPPSGSVPNPPPITVPSPSIFVPSPPVFEPPVVYPPPAVPPPHRTAPNTALWCVVKPSVPDPIVREAMNYACGSGADCDSILPNGSCFQPNTLFAHASFAFNSYWQRTKVAGGTCDFGGTAMLVTVDPSHDGCQFIYY